MAFRSQTELLESIEHILDKHLKAFYHKSDQIITALGGSPILYNVTNVDVVPSGDTYSSPECHSFSISVLGTSGSITMEINGTTVTLPSGMNLNLQASTTFAAGMFEIAAGTADAVVTTITAT